MNYIHNHQYVITVVCIGSMFFAPHTYAEKHNMHEDISEEISVDSANDSTMAHTRVSLERSLDVIRAKAAALRDTSENSCSSIEAIESVLEVISSDLDQLGGCSGTAITQDGTVPAPVTLIEAAGITIDSQGYYCVARNIDASAVTTAIEINASNVTLDLNNQVISGNTGDCVLVAPSLSNITIKNGVITSFNTGINASDANAIKVINCIFQNQQDASVSINDSTNVLVQGCSSNGPLSIGFNIAGCTNAVVSDCVVRDAEAGESIYGFILEDGSANLIGNCTVDELSTQLSDSTVEAFGIKIRGTETASSVVNCVIKSVTAPTDPTFAAPGFVTLAGISVQAMTGSLTASGTIATGANVESVAWSPDGQYLAVGTLTNGGTELRVYVLTDLGTLLLLPGANIEIGADVVGLAWSPDGQYLAICFGNSVTVYSFVAQTLTSVATVADVGDAVRAISWSADGYYLAFGLITGTVNELQVWSFTGTALTSITSVAYGANVNSVDWSPNNHWIALGDENAVAAIYNFDGVTLTSLDTQSTGGGFLNQVAWSPHGDFLAIVQTGSSSPIVYPVTNTGTFGTGINGASASSSSVAWSPDGRFLAYYDSDTTLRTAQLRRTGGVFSLLPIASIAVTTVQSSLSWSNDGHMVATGGVLNAGVGVRAYFVEFTGPTNCVIQDCTISNVSGSQGTGVGLYASSDDNLAIGNVAFENDINYVGLSNIYNGGYFGTPTLIQNIGASPQ